MAVGGAQNLRDRPPNRALGFGPEGNQGCGTPVAAGRGEGGTGMEEPAARSAGA